MKADLRAMKSMLQKINALGVEEVRWTVGKGKLHGRYVDPAHVAMFDMTLKLENCNMKPMEIGINLYNLFFKIHKLPLGNMREKESPENKLRMEFVMGRDAIRGLKFRHPMLTFRKSLADIAGIPDANLPESILKNIKATANINRRQFKIFLDIAEKETDHITFIAERKGNKLRAEYSDSDDELTDTDLTYSLGGIEGIDLKFADKETARVKALFSVDYMKNFVNNLKAPTMKIGLKDDNPLVVWWNEGELLSGIYMLAPRIESE